MRHPTAGGSSANPGRKVGGLRAHPSGVDILALSSRLGGNVDHMSDFPKGFNQLVNEARAAHARAEAERRDAAAAVDARLEDIQQLPQLAERLAAKAEVAQVKPDKSVRMAGERKPWPRKSGTDVTVGGWEVYRWTRTPSNSTMEKTYSVFLTTDGRLLACLLTMGGSLAWVRLLAQDAATKSYYTNEHSFITGTAEYKDGKPVLVLFGAEVEAIDIMKGLADFVARCLPL